MSLQELQAAILRYAASIGETKPSITVNLTNNTVKWMSPRIPDLHDFSRSFSNIARISQDTTLQYSGRMAIYTFIPDMQEPVYGPHPLHQEALAPAPVSAPAVKNSIGFYKVSFFVLLAALVLFFISENLLTRLNHFF